MRNVKGNSGLDPKWVAEAFAAIAKKIEPGDWIKKVTVRESAFDEMIVITYGNRYFKITGESVTFKPYFSSPTSRAEVIAK